MKVRLVLRALVPAILLTNNACQNVPDPFSPPAQRQPLEDFRPYRISAIVDMADQEAPRHFVRDITSVGTPSWRWTGQRPTVKVRIRVAENIRYTIDFTLVEATLQKTGPITVSFLVNDRVLDRGRYASAGNLHFEKAIPAGWVTADQDVTVGAEVDKLWIPPDDSPKLGIILERIGLTQ